MDLIEESTAKIVNQASAGQVAGGESAKAREDYVCGAGGVGQRIKYS